MRKNNLNLAEKNLTQLPHPGLGGHGEKELLDLNRDWDDEKKRVNDGDISPRTFATHQYVQARYIPFFDPRIAHFEETPVLQHLKEVDQDNTPLDEFGNPCSECKQIIIVFGDGCMNCIAVVDQSIEGITCSLNEEENVSVSETAGDLEGHTRKNNRTKTKTVNPRLGKGGYTRATSPHFSGKGWKPSAPAVQKMTLGSTEARWNDPALQKKIKETWLGKIRKNTRAKVSALEKIKVTRKVIAKVKGKI